MLNKSGIEPLDFRVLVLPDKVGDKIGSIFIPDGVKDREKFAAVKGTVVAVGASACAEWLEKLAPGDRIWIAKYAGAILDGLDGEEYRICNDADVVARLKEEA